MAQCTVLINIKTFSILIFTGIVPVFHILRFIALCFRVIGSVCKINR